MTKVEKKELTNVEFLRSLTEEQKESILKNGFWKENESKHMRQFKDFKQAMIETLKAEVAALKGA